MEGFDYGIKAIPTEYNGTQYRSRLEAQWAAFFDLMRWPFQYEPFDADGWTPDFLIDGARKVLVEVKPILDQSQVGEFINRMVKSVYRDGIPAPNPDKGPRDLTVELAVLGLGPFKSPEGVAIGYLWDGCSTAPAVIGKWESQNPGGLYGFCHSMGQYVDRVTGSYDGGSYGGVYLDQHECWQLIQYVWNESGKVVQYWKASWVTNELPKRSKTPDIKPMVSVRDILNKVRKS